MKKRISNMILLLCGTAIVSAIALVGLTPGAYAMTNGIWTYEANTDGSYTATITACSRTGLLMTIPATLDNYTVTQVGKNSFHDNTQLQSVVISEGKKNWGLRI